MQLCFSGNLFAPDRDMVMHSACVSKGKTYLQTIVDSARHSMLHWWTPEVQSVCQTSVENVFNRKSVYFNDSRVIVADFDDVFFSPHFILE